MFVKQHIRSILITSLQIFLYCCVLTLTPAGGQHNYYWRDYRGVIPADAISGTENLYIAQVPYNGLLPATLYPEKHEAITECFGRKVVMKDGIKVLCDASGDTFFWEYVNVNKLTKEDLETLVIGGLEENTTLYIGKTYHEGEWKIGKVFPSTSQWKGLRVWYNNGSHYVTNDFQILKYRSNLIGIFDIRTNK